MRNYCSFMCCVFFGVEVLVLVLWYALNDKRLWIFFLSVTYIFLGTIVILIMTGCLNGVTVRVLTCSQKIFLWEMKYLGDLCARRNPLPVYINLPLSSSIGSVVTFQSSCIFQKKALWTWHLVISPTNVRATSFCCC